MRIEKSSALLKERYTYLEHVSGLPIYVFPKQMTGAYALFAVRYGSLDSEFAVNDTPMQTVPDGIAHFLEHKLFEAPDGSDAFARFSALGADANAYTDYTKTAYLFGCTDRFDEVLEELLTFVTQPHFTEESVKRERGIIAEELRMYEDSPWERGYQNLLLALYHKHPVRKNIGGTVKSIQNITPERLYDCYRTFYRLSNMALVVCGNVSAEQVLAVADRVLPKQKVEDVFVRRATPQEPNTVAKEYIEARMQVSKPIFFIGIKDPVTPALAADRLRRDLAMTLLNEVLFSQSETFYAELFEEGLITPSFTHGYSSAEGFGFNCISGESDSPKEVLKRLQAYLEQVKQTGLSKEAFERCRRVLYSDEVRAYDSTEEIANRLLSFAFDGSELFDVPDILQSLTCEELETMLRDFYVPSSFAMSVILPREKK
jgi:predicted Zn-dependent peptidase